MCVCWCVGATHGQMKKSRLAVECVAGVCVGYAVANDG